MDHLWSLYTFLLRGKDHESGPMTREFGAEDWDAALFRRQCGSDQSWIYLGAKEDVGSLCVDVDDNHCFCGREMAWSIRMFKAVNFRWWAVDLLLQNLEVLVEPPQDPQVWSFFGFGPGTCIHN